MDFIRELEGCRGRAGEEGTPADAVTAAEENCIWKKCMKF